MLLTEQVQTNRSKELSELCHKAKNLYNSANWYYRQDFFKLSNFLSYYDLDLILKKQGCYKQLPSQTSQQIIKLVVKNWKSYWKGIKKFKIRPHEFRFKKPKIPNYKKKNGEFIVIFTNQQCRIKQGYLYFPKRVNLKPIKMRKDFKLNQVRIIPLNNKYKIEIIYEKGCNNLNLNKNNILSIDLGLNNLITAVNNNGYNPFIIKGGIIKSINQFYNKKLARYKSVAKKINNLYETKRTRKLTLKRNNKIIDIFHKISRYVVNYCVKNDIGTIVIGKNDGWKQKINIGKINNQNFVSVPFFKLIRQIEYKGKLVGIDLVKQEEAYTSKCSFLDNEPIEKRNVYLGKRISRGLFRSKNGRLINADVNGAYNIMKKAFPNALTDGIEALVLTPEIISNFKQN